MFALPMIPIPPFTTMVPVLLETDATFPFTDKLFWIETDFATFNLSEIITTPEYP